MPSLAMQFFHLSGNKCTNILIKTIPITIPSLFQNHSKVGQPNHVPLTETDDNLKGQSLANMAGVIELRVRIFSKKNKCLNF